MKKNAEQPQLSYEESIDEIEAILESIEGDALPIDSLAPKIERAAELLEGCKQLLARTEVRVAQAIDVLRGESQSEPPDA